jgi:hypothetical protein
MRDLLEEGRNIQQLFKKRVLSEALNKDITAFGKDLEKRLKDLKLIPRVFPPKNNSAYAAVEPLKERLKTEPDNVLISFNSSNDAQELYLVGSVKQKATIEKAVNYFQLAKYTGPVISDPKKWQTKQIVGALNPGDIFLHSLDNTTDYVEYLFMRLAKVDTKSVSTDSSGKQTSQSVKSSNIF